MSIIVDRRFFLRGLFSVPIVVGLPQLLVPRILQREPYIVAGQVTDYIGLNLYPSPVFIGSAIVKSVGPWDGETYPCQLSFGFGRHQSLMTFPDHDLALLREEVPRHFWRDHTFEEWPNVHSWVRWKRFGEHPDVMRARHAAVVNGTPWPYRAAA